MFVLLLNWGGLGLLELGAVLGGKMEVSNILKVSIPNECLIYLLSLWCPISELKSSNICGGRVEVSGLCNKKSGQGIRMVLMGETEDAVDN